MYGIRDSVTIFFIKIGERLFEVLDISIAKILIIFERKFVLVKGVYIQGTYIWEAYNRDFTVSAFVNTNDMFTFNHFFRTREEHVYIK